MVDVDNQVVAVGHLAVEAHTAAAGLAHFLVAAHKLVLRDDHRLVVALHTFKLHREVGLVYLVLDDGAQFVLLLFGQLFGDGVVVGNQFFDRVGIDANEACLLDLLLQ